MKKLVYILFFFLLSCKKDKDDFSFSINDEDKLKLEVQSFIDSLKSENSNATDKFRNKEVLWWNATWEQQLKDKPSIISTNLPLNHIKELENLEIDSLFFDNDTIKGLKNTSEYICHSTSLKEKYLETVYIYLVLNNNKISEIIKHHWHPTIRNHERLISINCFYMDDTEITPYTYSREDSIKHKIVPDSLKLHDNDYLLKEEYNPIK